MSLSPFCFHAACLTSLLAIAASPVLALAQPVSDEATQPAPAPPPAAALPPAPVSSAPEAPPNSGVVVIVTPAPVAQPAIPPVANNASPPPLAPVVAPPPSAPYEDQERDVAYPKRSHFMMRTGVGASFYSFHGDRIIVGGLDLSLGADTRAGSYSANTGLSFGRTEPGLAVWKWHLGPDLVWPIGIVRLGISPRIGLMGISRVTKDDTFLFGTLGIAGIASVDLIHTDGFALALSARPSIESAGELGLFNGDNGGAVFGVQTLLDFRFRAAKGAAKPRKPKPLPY